MKRGLLAVAALWAVPGWSLGAISSVNAVRNGDFENNAYIEQVNLGTGKRPWQFNANYTPEEQTAISRANDVGYWMGSEAGGGAYYGGQAITLYDDARAAYAADHTKVITNGTMGAQNVSKDPNSNNHYLDSVAFRKGAGQIFAASANTALAGRVTMSFDYVFADWDGPEANSNPVRLHARLYGLPTLPSFVDLALWDGGGDLGQITGEVLVGESTNWSNWGDVLDPNVQRTMDATPIWHDFARNFEFGLQAVGQDFQYYYLRIDMIVYSESSLYWNDDGGRPNDSLSVALDNVDIRLPLLGDTNRDGITNALDIQSFVGRVTTGVYQGEADTNKDRIVNALDIQSFVGFVTASGSAGGVVPEPATLGLLALGLLGLARRR